MSEPLPDDEEGEERGVCMNCGGDMDYSPMHPWCPECDEEDAAVSPAPQEQQRKER